MVFPVSLLTDKRIHVWRSWSITTPALSLFYFTPDWPSFCHWSSRCSVWRGYRPRACPSVHTHRPSWSRPSGSSCRCSDRREDPQNLPVVNVQDRKQRKIKCRMWSLVFRTCWRCSQLFSWQISNDVCKLWHSHLACVILALGVACAQHIGSNRPSRQHVRYTTLVGPQANVASFNALGELSWNWREYLCYTGVDVALAICWAIQGVPLNCITGQLTFCIFSVARDFALGPVGQHQPTFGQAHGVNLRSVYGTDAHICLQLQEGCRGKIIESQKNVTRHWWLMTV